MSAIAKTPTPPYYAVIFTSLRTDGDNGYAETAAKMLLLASQQPGYLGVESAREELGITVSYWADLDSIKTGSSMLNTKRRKKPATKNGIQPSR